MINRMNGWSLVGFVCLSFLSAFLSAFLFGCGVPGPGTPITRSSPPSIVKVTVDLSGLARKEEVSNKANKEDQIEKDTPPKTVRSIVLVVREPACNSNNVIDRVTQNLGPDVTGIFNLQLPVGARPCFLAQGFSDMDGKGALLYINRFQGLDKIEDISLPIIM